MTESGEIMTIKELSQILSVSPGTIDRVIHNRGRVSDKTATRVRECLEKYNYVANTNGQALATIRKKHSVAVITCTKNIYFDKIMQKGLTDNYNILTSLGVEIHNLGYSVRTEDEISKLLQKAISLNVDALIINTPSFDKVNGLLKQLKEKGCFIVALNNKLPESIQNVFIGHDNFSSARTAMQLLLSQLPKHSSVLVIAGDKDEPTHVERLNGVMSYYSEYGKDYELLDTITLSLKEPLKDMKNRLKSTCNSRKIDGVLILSLFNHLPQSILSYQNSKNAIIGAFDLTTENIDLLLNGSISFILEQNPYHQSKKCIEIIKNFFTLNEKFPSDYHTDITIVTKENIGTYLENHHYILTGSNNG